MFALPPVVGVYGGLGEGKSGWSSYYAGLFRKRYPYAPIISTVPISLPSEIPNMLFMARSIADYIAGGLVFSGYAWSAEAEALAKQPRDWLARKIRKDKVIHSQHIQNIFGKLQEDYRQVAQDIDWRDKSTLDKWILAHDLLVVRNQLGKKSIVEAVEEASNMLVGDTFYNMANFVYGDYRFKYRPPYQPFLLILDEIGVAASADDNAKLKESAFYPWLAQLRKFGGTVLFNGHHPSRVFKQLREVTALHIRVKSFDLRRFGIKQKLYFNRGYINDQMFDFGGRPNWWRLDLVPFSVFDTYPTYWIVRQPD